MKKLLLLLIFIVSASGVIAQPGWNWPENKAQAEEKNVLYTDYLKQQNCEAAVEHLDWLIENVPNLHVSIYQNGIKIYRCLIDKESDPVKKNELVDKALSLFDGRIENFGREAYVKNRKVTFAYTFYRSDKSQYEMLFNMFKDAFELNGNKIDYFPAAVEDQLNVKPVYKTFKGWKSKTQGIKKFDDLPNNAKIYVKAIEEFIETKISSISTSPEREDTILLIDPFN